MDRSHALIPGTYERGLDELGYRFSKHIETPETSQWWVEWSGNQKIESSYKRIDDIFILNHGFALKEFKHCTLLTHEFGRELFLSEPHVRKPLMKIAADLARLLNADEIYWVDDSVINRSPVAVTLKMEFDETRDMISYLSNVVKIDADDFNLLDRYPVWEFYWWYLIQPVTI